MRPIEVLAAPNETTSITRETKDTRCLVFAAEGMIQWLHVDKTAKETLL